MPKIQLSAEEMQLVADPSWILTKHRVIEKVYFLLGALSDKMQAYLQENKQLLPAVVLQLPPRISKGEQYEALPYVVLDYPRLFSKEEVFAVRSFFWWGNYFSITLHLKGRYQLQYHKKIMAALSGKKLQHYYISFSGNEFNFNLHGKDYTAAGATSANKLNETEQVPFLKLSYKISFEQWDTAEEKLLQAFKQLVGMVTEN